MNDQNGKLLLNPREVAAELGIGETKVYALIRRREIRSVKIGKSRRVSRRALQEYIERLEGVRDG